MKTEGKDNVIKTAAVGLRHGSFQLPVADGSIDAYFAAPDRAGRAPIVLVIQEIFGLHEHIRDVCRRFAHAGFLAVSPELYQRQGNASAYTDNAALVRDIVSKVPDSQVMNDLDACLVWAGLHGGNLSQVAVTGFCWGGRLTWMYAAHQPKVNSAVAWYGRLTMGHGPLQTRNPVDVAASLYCPVLCLYGGQDASIPTADVQKMREALARGNAHARESAIHVYQDAGHAFYADYRPTYDRMAAQDGWRRCLAWIVQHTRA